MPVRTQEFVVHETGSVVLYYPKDDFTIDQVMAIYKLGDGRPRTHPVLKRFRVSQVDESESYIVVRFDR